MTGHDYRSVAARIRQELPELDRVARRASRAWASASADPEDLYVDATALNVHGFYAGWSASSPWSPSASTALCPVVRTGIRTCSVK